MLGEFLLYNESIMMLHLHHHRTIKILILVVAVILLTGGGIAVGILVAKPADSPATPAHQAPAKSKENPQAVAPKPAPTPLKPDYILPPIQNGMVPMLTQIPTSQPVVFLGIDDGGYKDPSELQLLKDNNIRATLFLSNAFISDNPDFFKPFLTANTFIEDHTLHHYTNLPRRPYSVQKAEICGEADYMARTYGRRPLLFRPPGGSYNALTLKAAADCGMKAAINWIAKANGGSMQYQIGNKLRPGDIVLMHFRPVFKQDLQAFIQAQNAAGLHTELLEDWLGAR